METITTVVIFKNQIIMGKPAEKKK